MLTWVSSDRKKDPNLKHAEHFSCPALTARKQGSETTDPSIGHMRFKLQRTMDEDISYQYWVRYCSCKNDLISEPHNN